MGNLVQKRLTTFPALPVSRAAWREVEDHLAADFGDHETPDPAVTWLNKAFRAYLRSRRNPEAISALAPQLAKVFDELIRDHRDWLEEMASRSDLTEEEQQWVPHELPITRRIMAWAFEARR